MGKMAFDLFWMKILLFFYLCERTLADRTCRVYGRTTRYVICPDYDGTSAYCCGSNTGEACCYQYEFWYTWYFWCACFVILVIILALVITCCKAYNAKKRRVTSTSVMTSQSRRHRNFVFDVDSPHRQTQLPMYDFPPTYAQIRNGEFPPGSIISNEKVLRYGEVPQVQPSAPPMYYNGQQQQALPTPPPHFGMIPQLPASQAPHLGMGPQPPASEAPHLGINPQSPASAPTNAGEAPPSPPSAPPYHDFITPNV